MGEPLASNPDDSECCAWAQTCSISPVASGGFWPVITYMATAMLTTTNAMMVVMTRWPEPLVNSSPRAASSSSVEDCCRRLIANLSYRHQGATAHEFVHCRGNAGRLH